MSSYYHYNAHQHPTSANAPVSSHSHHGGRSRRAPRLSTSQNTHKHFRGVRSMKELTDTASVTAFRQKFEAGRSFDLDDDMEFCPALLTESDVSPRTLYQHPILIYQLEIFQMLSRGLEHVLTGLTQLVSIHSSSSDRSSLSSGSPESSPTQQPQQVTSAFSLNSQSNPYIPSAYQQSSNLKLHQPAATRIRNAIPIVNPSTGISMSSPPPSVSPGRMQQRIGQRW
jgi:hypothetical protein